MKLETKIYHLKSNFSTFRTMGGLPRLPRSITQLTDSNRNTPFVDSYFTVVQGRTVSLTRSLVNANFIYFALRVVIDRDIVRYNV